MRPKKDPETSAGTKNFFKISLGLAGAFHVLLIPCLHFVINYVLSLRFRPVTKMTPKIGIKTVKKGSQKWDPKKRRKTYIKPKNLSPFLYCRGGDGGSFGRPSTALPSSFEYFQPPLRD